MMTEIPNDPQFPRISFALDESLMRETLQGVLLSRSNNCSRHLLITECRIGERRYKPDSSCKISYHLHILDTETGSVHQQLVCARLCKKGTGLYEFDREKSKNLFSPNGVEPIVYLPKAEAIVWSFPNDRKLTHLPIMMDPPFLCKFFPVNLLPLNLNPSKRLTNIEAEVIHYLPERSCMIRYQLELEGQNKHESERRTIFGKIYRDPIVGKVYRTMSQLYQRTKTLITAQPLGYDAELKALWQADVPGWRFAWDDINDPHRLREMELIGLGTAEFHATSIDLQNQFQMNDIKRSLRESCHYLERTKPDYAERIRYLAGALIRSSAEIENYVTPLTPIHRDLKIGNILIHDRNIALIDMDTVRLGDPLSDIGSFIANFHKKGMKYRVAESRIQELLEVYCRAYSESVDWQVTKTRLNWYIAASLVYEVIRRGIHKWKLTSAKDLNQCLDLSERYCFGKI